MDGLASCRVLMSALCHDQSDPSEWPYLLHYFHLSVFWCCFDIVADDASLVRLPDHHDETYPLRFETGLMQLVSFLFHFELNKCSIAHLSRVSMMTTRVLLLPLRGDEKLCDGLSETQFHGCFDVAQSCALMRVSIETSHDIL